MRGTGRIGFDLIDLHGTYGCPIHHFISRISNQRTEEYGGSLAYRWARRSNTAAACSNSDALSRSYRGVASCDREIPTPAGFQTSFGVEIGKKSGMPVIAFGLIRELGHAALFVR